MYTSSIFTVPNMVRDRFSFWHSGKDGAKWQSFSFSCVNTHCTFSCNAYPLLKRDGECPLFQNQTYYYMKFGDVHNMVYFANQEASVTSDASLSCNIEAIGNCLDHLVFIDRFCIKQA